MYFLNYKAWLAFALGLLLFPQHKLCLKAVKELCFLDLKKEMDLPGCFFPHFLKLNQTQNCNEVQKVVMDPWCYL